MKKTIFLAILLAFSASFAIAQPLSHGSLQKPSSNNTSDTVANAGTSYMAINSPTYNNGKSKLPGYNQLTVQLNVTRVDSVKTAYAKLEASNDGIAWFEPSPNDSVIFAPKTTGTETLPYTLKYGPVIWKNHRVKIIRTGIQKFIVKGSYNNP